MNLPLKKIIYTVLITISVACSSISNDKLFIELTKAVKENNTENTKNLLHSLTDIKNSINQKDSLGNNLLFYTVTNNNLELSKLLLTNGIDVNTTNQKDITPLDLARHNNSIELVALIHKFQFNNWMLEKNKFTPQHLEYAIYNDNTLILKEFLLTNKQIDTFVLSNDFSPLITALFTNSTNTAMLLIEHGADPNNQFDTRSVLAMAVLFNQPKVVELLLKKGADVNADDGALTTSLMFAAEEGNEEIAKLLLQHHADASRKDKSGETAYDKALKNKHTQLAALLKS